MKVTAVIVARGGSVRIPKKNLLTINKSSLIKRKINQLMRCRLIDEIIVGSDDHDILEEASINGATPVLRPDDCCDERITSANQMIKNMCNLIETDIVVWTHCTNPLVSTSTYDKAISKYFDASEGDYDSLLSVFEVKEHLWDSNHNPMNYNPYQERHPLASELPVLYAQDGAIFIQPHKQMKENSYFFGQKPKLFIIPPEEVMDINTYHDFQVAKSYIEAQEKCS